MLWQYQELTATLHRMLNPLQSPTYAPVRLQSVRVTDLHHQELGRSVLCELSLQHCRILSMAFGEPIYSRVRLWTNIYDRIFLLVVATFVRRLQIVNV